MKFIQKKKKKVTKIDMLPNPKGIRIQLLKINHSQHFKEVWNNASENH